MIQALIWARGGKDLQHAIPRVDQGIAREGPDIPEQQDREGKEAESWQPESHLHRVEIGKRSSMLLQSAGSEARHVPLEGLLPKLLATSKGPESLV